MVCDGGNVIQEISKGILPDIIEIKSELPELTNSAVIMASVKRWKEIRDYFQRPLRIYATCENLIVEKMFVSATANFKDIYLSVIPSSRKEMLNIE